MSDASVSVLQAMRKLLALYLSRFSSISGNMINCGTILNWLEVRLTVAPPLSLLGPGGNSHLVQAFFVFRALQIDLSAHQIVTE